MFESLDDTRPIPQTMDTDALRSWRTGRARVRHRYAATVSSFVLVAGGGFALVDQPTSESVVSSTTKTERDAAVTTTTLELTPTTTVAPATDGVAPIVGSDDDPSAGSPAPGDDSTAPSDPSDDDAPDSAPAPGTPDAAPPPADGSTPPAVPSTPTTTAPPAPDPGPPAPPADEVWTVASQSLTQITAGTTPVITVTFTVQNNTASARYVAYVSCMPAYNWFDIYPENPGMPWVYTGPGSGCVFQFMWVQAHSQETRTVSATLKLATGPIPPGDYQLQMMLGTLTVPLRVV